MGSANCRILTADRSTPISGCLAMLSMSEQEVDDPLTTWSGDFLGPSWESDCRLLLGTLLVSYLMFGRTGGWTHDLSSIRQLGMKENVTRLGPYASPHQTTPQQASIQCYQSTPICCEYAEIVSATRRTRAACHQDITLTRDPAKQAGPLPAHPLIANQRTSQSNHSVLPAPAAPAAPLAATALALTPRVSAGLRTSGSSSISTGTLPSSSASSTGTSTGALTAVSDRNAGAAARSLSIGAGGSCRAVLGSAVLGSGGAGRSRAGAVELALDECEGVLTVFGAVALMGGSIAAVAAVWVGAVAVRLHFGSGLGECSD
jgi:hypothetical protein